MDKLGNLIAIPGGHSTIYITFNSKAKDQDQIESEIVGVYTDMRSNFHAINEENEMELTRIVDDMFHYDVNVADVIDSWYSVDKNGNLIELFDYSL